MKKYGLLIHHKEYMNFLHELQGLGIIHTLQQYDRLDKSEVEGVEEFVAKINDTIKYLTDRNPDVEPEEIKLDGTEIVEDITNLREKLAKLERKWEQLKSQQERLDPWGEFEPERIQLLEEHGIYTHFFFCKLNKFDPDWNTTYPLEKIHEHEVNTYFVIFSQAPKAPDLSGANNIDRPETTSVKLQLQITSLNDQINEIHNKLDRYAASCIEPLQLTRGDALTKLEYDRTLVNTESGAEGGLMILEGFVPANKSKELKQFLDQKGIVYIEEVPDKSDTVPILLQSGSWAKLFHPITKLFSLPTYGEMDLTPFFAPFFLLFFGFCLGDAGYGLLILIGAIIYYFRTQNTSQKDLMKLAMLLGIGTTVFGTITGTFFGVQLAEVTYFQEIKDSFLNYDQILTLSMILGIIQIMFGIILKAYQKIRWKKYTHALADVGWIILILSLLDLYLIKRAVELTQYSAWGSLGIIVLFSNPDAPILERLGAGIWGLYNITGIFGDVLSYIRLFALGVSSSILGLVVNNIALEFSSAPYIGPVLLVLILVFGHGINIMISSLGAFVHPMRLTFVEFYKNAGFTGGGRPYNPFSKEKHLKN